MTNRLFDFNFVDRRDERKIIADFIDQKTKTNILWINGQSGVGKSFLIENTFLINKSCKDIYICPQAQGQINNSLEEFIKQVQNATKENFAKFIKSNYSSIADIAKNVIKAILEYKNIDIDWFIDNAFDTSKLFVNKKNEKQNTSKLIQNYVETAIKKEKLMVILDNFTYCDYDSQQVFLNLIMTNKNNNQIQFVISTTHEKLEEQTYLKKLLLEKLDTEYIFLTGFNNEQYFKKILENKFIMTPELSDLVSYVYKICKGIPESLKEVIRNLALSNSIEHNDLMDKSTIKVESLKNYLLNYDTSKLPKIDFHLINDIESFFLQTLTYVKYQLPISVLENIFDYLWEKMFNMEVRKTFPFTMLINKYIGIDVLQSKKENNITIISFKHDLLYWKLNENFYSYVNKDLIFYYLYQYTKKNKDIFINSGINNNKLQEMIVYYSYRANVDEWIELNYCLGKRKYDLSLYYEAIKIFERISPKLQCLTESQKLNIAKCYYDVGQYNECILILKSINCEQLIEKSELYFEWGKALFVKLDALEAIKKLDISMKYVTPDKQDYYNIIAMKLVALAESPNGNIMAKEFFKSDIKRLVKDKSCVKFLGNILRNCWAYCTGTDAINYLGIALSIAKEKNNDIEIAYTYNNLGLEYIREWELDKACDVYMKSLKLLDNTKKHEISYPLNNLAVCAMLNKKYQTALDYLLEAMLWNRAPFMDKVIKTNLLICNLYLNNAEQCQLFAKELSEYLFNNKIQNENIIRRISLNLCIYYRNINEIEKAKECILLAYKYIKKSICEYRGTVLYNEIMNENEPLDTIKYSSKFFREMAFEPWITLFSHE